MWFKILLTGTAAALLTFPGFAQTQPVLRVVRTTQPGNALLQNGNFEQLTNTQFAAWAPYGKGYLAAPGQGRNGSVALYCDNADSTQNAGASQTLLLNRTNVAPFILRGWSKAQNVSGNADNDYSLYVDILYTDGTPLWGHTARFHPGTHDWEQRQLLILPAKPVKSLTLHCLLRKHSGRAWFDDVTLEELVTPGDAVLFQGAPMWPTQPQTSPGAPTLTLTTRDGLKLSLADNAVSSFSVAGRDLRSQAPSGFLVRDVAADSDVYDFHHGQCPALGLKLETHWKAERNCLVAEGQISELAGKDRAITLIFALPLQAKGWQWGDDIRHSRPITGTGDFASLVTIGCGATGTMSQYPVAAVYDARTGVALALDLAQPAQFRLGYHAGLRQLYLAYDFALAPEPQQFPRSAPFRFVLFQFDPRWGFRAAFQKFTALFPDYFSVRSHDQGIWMPFTDISKVEGWQDFGFKYHEGNNNVPWDDDHGILSFRYTEPMTWWMRMPKGTPRTIPAALKVRDELARSNDAHQRRMAQVSAPAAMWDETGQPSLLFRSEPWCDGAVWSLNPNPRLPTSSGGDDAARARDNGAFNAATVYWNDELKQSLYGPGAKGRLDGEYLDSLEGYVTSDLNFRREHFRYTSVPLCFDSETRRPALYKGLAVFEFTKWLSTQVHGMSKLMFANGVPYRFAWLCPWLDVMGTETDWLHEGKYRPSSDAQMCFWRTMSGQKPYLLLMNTDFGAFGPESVERYFQRSLFYGMYPSMFSHNAADNPYWQNPRWYNRDRQLFLKYQPLIKKVAEAGWQPVSLARCDNQQIWVERFGPDAQGTVYFTVLNDSTLPQAGSLRVDANTLRFKPGSEGTELVAGTSMQAFESGWKIELMPQEVKVIRAVAADTHRKN